jgi:kynurenine formamidase
VEFDFVITFANGGGLQGQRFRLDIDGDDIADAELADELVRDLRLLMVESVRILNKRVISERHKRRATSAGTAPVTGGARAVLIDLSHPIEDGMVTYKGLPAPVICDYLSREQSRALYTGGTEFHIGKIEMVANTGTYLDSPFHRYPDGRDLAALDLARLADLDGVVVRVEGMAKRAVSGAMIAACVTRTLRDCAILVQTGWDRHWRTDTYFEGHPYLTEDAATMLRDGGVALVGIDSYNIDDTADGRRPVHTALLGADIPIVEHLCGLDQLPTMGFRFSAVPVKVQGMGTFPVRAYAQLSTTGAP